MDILKRELAPISDGAWKEIDEAIAAALRARLCGRRVVDVMEARGLDLPAIGLGRLDMKQDPEKSALGYGVHTVLPLTELRVRFKLPIWELDNAERGAADLDLSTAEEAARQIADFEDGAIFNGLPEAGISGVNSDAAGKPVPLVLEPAKALDAVAQAVQRLHDAGIGGPYCLVAGPKAYRAMAMPVGGHTLRAQVQHLLGGEVLYNPVLSGAVLVSMRGGDFVLHLGQDLSVGYETHDSREIRFYISESFTFRVLEPGAAVRLPLGGAKR